MGYENVKSHFSHNLQCRIGCSKNRTQQYKMLYTIQLSCDREKLINNYRYTMYHIHHIVKLIPQNQLNPHNYNLNKIKIHTYSAE